MLYLLLSILFSTSLVIILRLFERWKIDTRYGIVFNYLVCVITGLTAMEDIAQLQQIATWNGWAACLLLGVGFILIFN
ncbi:MAG: EamA/RhaT family transporter, partial [Chitinophagales bacterium]|nr:EamA/RhaT family transporter [Chitinophagales bacterium]